MPVCRLIFRLDFEINFDIIEHPGKIMQRVWTTFQEEGQKGVEIRENRNDRRILARFVSENRDVMRDFNVEPTSINGSFETVTGLGIEQLQVERYGLPFLAGLAEQICKEFNIHDIIRSGLRFFYFNKLGREESDLLDTYHEMFAPDVLNNLRSVLGTVDDYGIAFDGSFDDGLHYHFKTGPYHSIEAEKYLSIITSNFTEQTDFDVVHDLDLYDTNFSLSERPLLNIYRPMIMKAKAIIETTENEIMKKLEGV